MAAVSGPEERPRHDTFVFSRLREALAEHTPTVAALGLLPDLDLRSEAPGAEHFQSLAERLSVLLCGL
jgi:hypothetical protein